MISPDLHFRDVLAFMCSNVFNCDLDRAIKTHRLSYRESTVNKLSALFFTLLHAPAIPHMKNEANSFEER
jgi:hypothetical protein